AHRSSASQPVDRGPIARCRRRSARARLGKGERSRADLGHIEVKWTARLAALGANQSARQRIVSGAAQGLMSAAAALIAYLPTKPLGLQEGFWGSITAIAVVQ